MIIISDIQGTLVQSNGVFNTELIEVYRLAAEQGIKTYLFTNNGLSGYRNPLEIKKFNDFLEKVSAEKMVFFSDDGIVQVSKDSINKDESFDIIGLSKASPQSYQDIKNCFPEENEFVYVEDQFLFLMVAEEEGYKPIHSVTSHAAQDLLNHINEKTGLDLKLSEQEPAVNLYEGNKDNIARANQSSKTNFFSRLFNRQP